ncbi:uncharacterized protein LOC143888605 [Tasmannia lanceolata]|uniref:uncharacterized protein LOC143888605 n=1 Tax=Tasmannia lanceolata TaxID=3420 RepID=UPI004063E69D
MGIKKWRPYLLNNRFIIRTDQKSLKFLLEQRIDTLKQQEWVSKLFGYDFVVEYKKGTLNGVADALSRQDLFGISTIVPQWYQTLKAGYQSDQDLQDLLKQYNEGTHDHYYYTIRDGILYHEGILLSATNAANEDITRAMREARWGAIPASTKHCTGLLEIFHGLDNVHMFEILSENVTYVSELRRKMSKHMGLCNQCQFLRLSLRTVAWILLRVC